MNNIFVEEPSAEQREQQEKYLNFIRNSDLLVADAQFTEEEYPGVVGFGRTSVELVVRVAEQAGVKQLCIFHHAPSHTDRTLDELCHEYHNKYSPSFEGLTVFWAREGQSLVVGTRTGP